MEPMKVRDVLERIINLSVPHHGCETAIKELAWAALYGDTVPTWKQLETAMCERTELDDQEVEEYRQALYRVQLALAQERDKVSLYHKHVGEWKEKHRMAVQGREELRRHLAEAKAQISQWRCLAEVQADAALAALTRPAPTEEKPQ